MAVVVVLGAALLAGRFVLLPSISQRAAKSSAVAIPTPSEKQQQQQPKKAAISSSSASPSSSSAEEIAVVLPDAAEGASLERREQPLGPFMPPALEVPSSGGTAFQKSHERPRHQDETYVDLWLEAAEQEAKRMQLFEGKWSSDSSSASSTTLSTTTTPAAVDSSVTQLVSSHQGSASHAGEVDVDSWLDDADSEAESMKLWGTRAAPEINVMPSKPLLSWGHAAAEESPPARNVMSSKPLHSWGDAAAVTEEATQQEDVQAEFPYADVAAAALAACSMLCVAAMHVAACDPTPASDLCDMQSPANGTEVIQHHHKPSVRLLWHLHPLEIWGFMTGMVAMGFFVSLFAIMSAGVALMACEGASLVGTAMYSLKVFVLPQ